MATGKIVYATDYSEASEYALEYACRLATSSGDRLLIVNVSEHELYPVGEVFFEEPQPSPKEFERLNKLCPKTQASNASTTCCTINPAASRSRSPRR